MRSFIALIVLLVLGSAPALATTPLNADTPSGQPEALFRDTTVFELTNTVLAWCIQSGGAVDLPNPSQVTCAKRIAREDPQGAYPRLLMPRGTTPILNVRYTMIQLPEGVHISAYSWFSSDRSSQTIEEVWEQHFNRVTTQFHDAGGEVPGWHGN